MGLWQNGDATGCNPVNGGSIPSEPKGKNMNRKTAQLNGYEWLFGEKVKLKHNSGKGKSVLKKSKIEDWHVIVRKTGHNTIEGHWVKIDPMIMVSPTNNPEDEGRFWILEKNDPDFLIQT